MSDEDDDLCALKSDPETDALAELFEPELQEEVRMALRSMRQTTADASNARKAAESRSHDFRRSYNVYTRKCSNPGCRK